MRTSDRAVDEREGASAATRATGYLRSTIRHGSMYTLGVVLSRLVGFVMIPVYTRVLTPEDYGVLEVLSLTADIVAMFAGMGIGMAVIRYYYLQETPRDQLKVVSTAATLLLVVFGIIGVAGLAVAGPAASLLLGDGTSAWLVRLAAVNLVLGATLEVPMVLLRARQHSGSVVAIGIVRLIIGLSLNILFVVILRVGVAGILLSSIISSGLVSAYLMVRMFRETGFAFSTVLARQLIAFGAPLVVWNLGSFVLHFSDRYFLRVFDSLAAVGLYSLSYKLAMLISMFVSGPFNDIWVPKSLEVERNERDGAVSILQLILAHYNVLLVSVGLGIALFAGDVIRIATGADFHAAARPVPLLALAMVFFGYRGISQVGALIRERSDLVAKSTVMAALLVLGLNALLIPEWGVMGAAAATALAFGAEFLIMRHFSMRVYPMHIGLRRTIAPLAAGCGTWVLAALLIPSSAPLWYSILGHAVAFLGFAALLLLIPGFLPDDQRAQLRAALRRPRQLLSRLRGA